MSGLYNKYIVTNADGSPVEGATFTLRPKDRHAQRALLCYADSVHRENPDLARDLREMVRKQFPVTEHYPHANDGFWELYDVYEHLGAGYGPELPPYLQHGETIEVHDSAGEGVVARIVHEYDPGVNGCSYLPNGDPGYPSEPGYSFWRFMTTKEGL